MADENPPLPPKPDLSMRRKPGRWSSNKLRHLGNRQMTEEDARRPTEGYLVSGTRGPLRGEQADRAAINREWTRREEIGGREISAARRRHERRHNRPITTGR